MQLIVYSETARPFCPTRRSSSGLESCPAADYSPHALVRPPHNPRGRSKTVVGQEDALERIMQNYRSSTHFSIGNANLDGVVAPHAVEHLSAFSPSMPSW